MWVIIGVGNVLLQCSAINFLSISYPNGNITFMMNLHCKQIYFLVHTTSSAFNSLVTTSAAHISHHPVGWFKFNMIYDYIWYRTIELFRSKLSFRRTGKLIFHEAQIYSHTNFAARSVFAQLLFLLKRFPFNSSYTHPRNFLLSPQILVYLWMFRMKFHFSRRMPLARFVNASTFMALLPATSGIKIILLTMWHETH